MKFLAHIKNREIVFDSSDAYVRHNLGKLEGKRCTVEVKKVFNKRSLDQNALMWAWFTIIADHTGYSTEEVHVIVKGLYCPKKLVKMQNKTYTIPRGTSELSKGEMVELMLRIQAMAADLGVILPSPEEYKLLMDTPVLISETETNGRYGKMTKYGKKKGKKGI